MKSAERIVFGVLIGIAILLCLLIFGRAMAQYVVYISGSDRSIGAAQNSQIYDLDTVKTVNDILLK